MMKVVARVRYPEGPTVLPNCVCCVSYADDEVIVIAGGVESRLSLPRGSGPTGLARLSDGRTLACCYDAHTVTDLRAGWKIPFPNDIVADERGGAFVTSSGSHDRDPFDPDLPHTGTVYYCDGVGCERLLLPRPLHYANGVALAFGGAVLLVAEHFENRVVAYDVDYTQLKVRLSNERVALELPALPVDDQLAGPDGLCVEGDRLFVAHFGGARVVEAELTRSGTGPVRCHHLPPELRYTTNVAVVGRKAFVTGFPSSSTLGSLASFDLP